MKSPGISISTTTEMSIALHELSLEVSVENRPVERHIPLPRGLRAGNGKCPFCAGVILVAVLITESASEEDPDLQCQTCGAYW